MTTTQFNHTWTSNSGRGSRAADRRSAEQVAYHPHYSAGYDTCLPEPALNSNSTVPSALPGTIAEPGLGNRQSWGPSPHMQQMSIAGHSSAYPGVAGQSQVPFGGITHQNVSGEELMMDEMVYQHESPESQSPPSPSYHTFGQDQYMQSHSIRGSNPVDYVASPNTSFSRVSPPHGQDGIDHELTTLRRTKQALEYECRVLQNDLQRLHTQRVQLMRSTASASPNPPNPTFQASWNTRTEARIRYLCSLNRAGNALCAWHDSRRERRAYPPRNAPSGYLNCGCTFEEALFEESLSRHHVGSYLPGEAVRMDPALRNPLLKLLQRRFGYKDGEFERDPRTGEWLEGEGPAKWERLAQSGPSISRRKAESSNS